MHSLIRATMRIGLPIPSINQLVSCKMAHSIETRGKHGKWHTNRLLAFSDVVLYVLVHSVTSAARVRNSVRPPLYSLCQQLRCLILFLVVERKSAFQSQYYLIIFVRSLTENSVYFVNLYWYCDVLKVQGKNIHFTARRVASHNTSCQSVCPSVYSYVTLADYVEMVGCIINLCAVWCGLLWPTMAFS